MLSRPSRLIYLLALLGAGACSTPAPLPPVQALKPKLVLEDRPVQKKENSSETVQRIERKISRTPGSAVLISKKLLKRLIEEAKNSEEKRSKLSAQLEALKRVDVQ
jgi:hypothetical protein